MPAKFILIYYLIINIILFALMGIDKFKAKNNSWRIPEANLFVAALLGGGIGGIIGMHTFHHKTTKLQFYIIFGISIFLHIALLYFIFLR